MRQSNRKDNHYHLLSTYCGLGTVLSASVVSSEQSHGICVVISISWIKTGLREVK